MAIRCAGVRGEIALDDVYVAGRLVERIDELAGPAFLTDGARSARAIARAYADPLAALADSQSARDLDGTGHEPDVARCALESVFDIVPRVSGISRRPRRDRRLTAFTGPSRTGHDRRRSWLRPPLRRSHRMHASISHFTGDPDDICRCVDELCPCAVPADNVRLLLIVRRDDGITHDRHLPDP